MPLGSFTTYSRTAGHLDPIITHEKIFTNTEFWTVPEGVHEISAVCVGGGGGGFITSNGGGGGAGGDLRWGIKIPVTPGETLTVEVGQGGVARADYDGHDSGTPGIPSSISRSGTPLLVAAGGAAGSDDDDETNDLPPRKPQNGNSTSINLPLVGGGTGGRGGWEELSAQAGGGGGAGGYYGVPNAAYVLGENAGAGGHADEGETYEDLLDPKFDTRIDLGYDGEGGGGSGGTAGGSGDLAGGGGGVGLFGRGLSGRAYGTRQNVSWYVRSLGSGGYVGESGSPRDGNLTISPNGLLFGGGGAGGDRSDLPYPEEIKGAQGAVRIIWGRNRYFPTANTPTLKRFPARDNNSPTLISYTTPGVYSFTVPDGVTSINALAIGAGGGANSGDRATLFASAGGGGGGLAYANDIAVTPGETITVVVGVGGEGITSTTASDLSFAENGENSVLKRGATDLLIAEGGEGGQSGGEDDEFTHSGGDGGGFGGTLISLGAGFTGGKGGDSVSPGGPTESVRLGGAGGGGAAGYLGNGGAGGIAGNDDGDRLGNSAAPNSGGAGGGGAASTETEAGGGGGGVGLPFLQSGALVRTGITGAGGAEGKGGYGGSGGARGFYTQSIGGNHSGGLYGGGSGAGGDSSTNRRYACNGASGAVQIAYGNIEDYPGTALPTYTSPVITNPGDRF